MSATARQIAALLPKLSAAEKDQIREALNRDAYARWKKREAKYRTLMKGRTKDKRPSSLVIAETRR